MPRVLKENTALGLGFVAVREVAELILHQGAAVWIHIGAVLCVVILAVDAVGDAIEHLIDLKALTENSPELGPDLAVEGVCSLIRPRAGPTPAIPA